jgi:hypothetical protein
MLRLMRADQRGIVRSQAAKAVVIARSAGLLPILARRERVAGLPMIMNPSLIMTTLKMSHLNLTLRMEVASTTAEKLRVSSHSLKVAK